MQELVGFLLINNYFLGDLTLPMTLNTICILMAAKFIVIAWGFLSRFKSKFYTDSSIFSLFLNIDWPYSSLPSTKWIISSYPLPSKSALLKGLLVSLAGNQCVAALVKSLGFLDIFLLT